MPELPEVETARRLIAGRALGRSIAGVGSVDTYVCRPHTASELRQVLGGRALTAALRRGKLIWCETAGPGGGGGPGPDLGIHLGMAGRIVVVSDGEEAEGGEWRPLNVRTRKAGWDRFSLEFADGGRLVLLDPRRLSRVRLNPDVDALGPDAGQVTQAEFRDLIPRMAAEAGLSRSPGSPTRRI